MKKNGQSVKINVRSVVECRKMMSSRPALPSIVSPHKTLQTLREVKFGKRKSSQSGELIRARWSLERLSEVIEFIAGPIKATTVPAQTEERGSVHRAILRDSIASDMVRMVKHLRR